MTVLAIDAGSSSLKFGLYSRDGAGALRCLDSGTITDPVGPSSAAVQRLLGLCSGMPAAIAHRLVFGGPNLVVPTLADAASLRALEALVPMEPLHLRPQLDLVYAAQAAAPGTPNVLCFDTAFHASMPAVAKRLPLPPTIDPSMRRYGFHGLSYEYVIGALGPALRGRAVIAHLGSGASLCATHDGRPIDTTMGFSALGGLMMATRPGDLDPGVLLQLMRLGYADRERLAEFLNGECGLAGVSGRSPDIRELFAVTTSDKRAREALELFDYQLLKHACAMIGVLGGLDALVFTGGIGEHQPVVRERLCRSLRFLGVDIDASANQRHAATISTAQSTVSVRVIATDETAVMARHAYELIGRVRAQPQ